ncbi:hypothetical protein SRHO_G00052500 [Serrasalmus rhombeus]
MWPGVVLPWVTRFFWDLGCSYVRPAQRGRKDTFECAGLYLPLFPFHDARAPVISSTFKPERLRLCAAKDKTDTHKSRCFNGTHKMIAKLLFCPPLKLDSNQK